MKTWKMKSTEGQHLLALVVVTILGALLLYAGSVGPQSPELDRPSRIGNYEVPMTERQAAQFLGFFLVSLAGLAFLSRHEGEIRLDEENGLIVSTQKSIWETRRYSYSFKSLASIRLRRQNTRPPHLYWVVLKLKTGSDVQLPWASYDRDQALEVAQEIGQIIGLESPVDDTIRLTEGAHVLRLVLSFFFSIGLYKLYYNFAVGPSCPAMWAGGFPWVFMLISFFTLWRVFGHLFKTAKS